MTLLLYIHQLASAKSENGNFQFKMWKPVGGININTSVMGKRAAVQPLRGTPHGVMIVSSLRCKLFDNQRLLIPPTGWKYTITMLGYNRMHPNQFRH